MVLYLLVNKWNYFALYPTTNADILSLSVTCNAKYSFIYFLCLFLTPLSSYYQMQNFLFLHY